MIQLTPKPGVVLLAVEVPVGTTTIHYDWFSCYLRFYKNDWMEGVDIPCGYEFIATTDQITKAQAMQLVQVIRTPLLTAYKSYYGPSDMFFSPIQSLLSLIQSAGGDPGNRWAILLKSNRVQI
jgi:hypothetical protein